MPPLTRYTTTIIYTTLSALELIVGVSAVFGGYGLITTNGLGMPVTWLSHSPFSSYFIPGLILGGIVGGTHLISAELLWKKSRVAPEALAISGCGLLIWIFTELYIINQPHWLQIVYFGWGIVTVIITLFLFKLRTIYNLS